MSLSLEQITDSWPHGMIVLDNDCRVVRWNQWMESASGVMKEQALGQTLDQLFPVTEVAERLLKAVKNATQDGTSTILTRTFTPHALPLRRGPKDEKPMHISIRVRSVRTEGGDRACLLDIHDETSSARRDVQMQAIQTQQKQQAIELQKANDALDFFVRHAAHDLRAPLRGVTSFLGMLREDLEGDVSDDVGSDLDHLDASAESMNAILEDLLSLSRSANMELEKHSVSLERCVDSALESLRGVISESGATIERSEWPRVEGNERLLTQLIQKLLHNAILHSDDDNRAPRVRLTIEHGSEGVIFGINDDGKGVPEGHEEEIWAPFRSLAVEGNGTGLGLSICRKIVERHNGRIWCESTVGQGAHFRFSLQSE